MKPRRRHLVLAAIALGLLGLSAADARGLRRYLKLQAEIERYEQRNDELASQNAALRGEIEALSGDPRALERAAREELGLVKPNELVFHFER